MRYVDLVAPHALRTSAGIELLVRSPLSRSVPLSVVTLALSVDGAEIRAGRVRFCVNDCDYRLSELPALHDEWWFTLDPARVRVTLPEAADTHEVDVELGLRMPFTPLAAGNVVRTRQRARVQVVHGEAPS